MAQARPIIVPVQDSPASFQALANAGAIARTQKAPVHVIHVIEVERSLPLDADMEWEARQGEQLLRRAEDVAKQNDFHVVGDLLQSRQAGQAIVDEAHAQNALAVVMGLRFRRVVGEFELGRTAAYVLKHARCPVWLVREAAHD